jgi:DNA-binding MarR family transcriptional regulator
MKTTTITTLSIVAPKRPLAQRTTRQTLHILSFIHRFRHVTVRHIQISLRHSNTRPTNIQLSLLRAKGYIARQYGPQDRSSNRAASYYLTPKGLEVLQQHDPNGKYRQLRSLKADISMRLRQIERYHTLADVYCHFKTHYDGQFEFSSAFDIASLEYMPDEVPDGYVRVMIPGTKTQHYLIEIYGWNRSTQMQRRRLYSYLYFAESERWQTMTNEPGPSLFIVAGSTVSQKRLNAQMANSLKESSAYDFKVYTTAAPKLVSEDSAIWRAVQSRTTNNH